MKNISLLVIALLLSSVSIASFASHSVRGYTRSNGTYVERHESMNPGERESSGYHYEHNERVKNDD